MRRRGVILQQDSFSFPDPIVLDLPIATLTEAQAARYIGIGLSTLRRKRIAGTGPVPCVIDPKLIRYLRADLDDYLAACRRPPERAA